MEFSGAHSFGGQNVTSLIREPSKGTVADVRHGPIDDLNAEYLWTGSTVLGFNTGTYTDRPRRRPPARSGAVACWTGQRQLDGLAPRPPLWPAASGCLDRHPGAAAGQLYDATGAGGSAPAHPADADSPLAGWIGTQPAYSAVRVIPCLDVSEGRVVKGVNFVDLVDAGDPVELARRYDEEGADELTFLDITATSDNRRSAYEMIRRTAEQVFIPLTVGGGVRTTDDIDALLRAGADKVSSTPRPWRGRSSCPRRPTGSARSAW